MFGQRGAAAWLALLALAVACSAEPKEPVRSEPLPPPPGPIADAGQWASRMGREFVAPAARKPALPLSAREAVMSDAAEASPQTVLAGRLVYRVSFRVPPIFRDHRAVVAAAAGELHIDVSLGRLRARFVGPGWPIDEGSEVRLRGDLLGVYLFDGQGGRSLGAGQLAAWFEGRERGEAQTTVGVRREYSRRAKSITDNEEPVPGELVCALFAEWGNQPRAWLAHRCSAGLLPPGFRIGPWQGELTAVVPMQLPRQTLRADQAEPPAKIIERGSRMLLEPEALVRLQPLRPAAEPERASLLIENRTDTRAIAIVQGVALGWVAAGQSLQVDGLAPGFYRVGAIRPLGVLRMAPRLVRVPGSVVIGLGEDDELAAGAGAMTVLLTALLLLAVFVTSLVSGVLGMAGGMLLMGVCAAVLPVAAAMVTHGAVQLIANGFRAVLHRRHLRWSIAAIFMLGSALIAAALTAVAYAPSKPWLYLLLGLIPGLVWVPERWLTLDAARPRQAFAAGLLVTGCNVAAGVAGPLADIFFVRTVLTRHEIVATKAATQVFSHLAKIVVYGLPLLTARASDGMPPLGFFVAMVPLSMAGGWAGGIVLDRLSDVGFKRMTRWVVTAIGVSYLITAARLFAAG